MVPKKKKPCVTEIVVRITTRQRVGKWWPNQAPLKPRDELGGRPPAGKRVPCIRCCRCCCRCGCCCRCCRVAVTACVGCHTLVCGDECRSRWRYAFHEARLTHRCRHARPIASHASLRVSLCHRCRHARPIASHATMRISVCRRCRHARPIASHATLRPCGCHR